MSIRSELESVLISYCTAHNIALSLEGVPFVKPTIPAGNSTTYYLQAFMLNSATTNPTVEMTRKRIRGFFQINCYAPDGFGSGKVEALADAVAALYPSYNKLAFPTVSIEQHPQTSQAFIDGPFRAVAVTVKYRQES